jgi:TPR repeat protein
VKTHKFGASLVRDSALLSIRPDLRARLQQAQELQRNDRAREAIPIYQELAEAGLVVAMSALADIYLLGMHGSFFDKLIGRLVPEPDKGYAYLRKAAERGDPSAQASLVNHYFDGIKPISKDYGEAFKWACLAVDNPVPNVTKTYISSLLAEMYANGLGCEKDLRHATLLWKLAKSWRDRVGGYVKSRSFTPVGELQVWAGAIVESYFKHFHQPLQTDRKISLPDSEWMQYMEAKIAKQVLTTR